MAYNLRRRSFINQLVDTEDQEANDRASSDEEDHVSEDDESGSGDDYAPSDSSEQSEESDNEYENASLDQRLLEVRARRENNPRVGRPTTTLRGKNGYKWSTRAPERSSGKRSKEHLRTTTACRQVLFNMQLLSFSPLFARLMFLFSNEVLYIFRPLYSTCGACTWPGWPSCWTIHI